MKYWEITRYYKYTGGDDKREWRAFEMRVLLPFPADWTESQVEDYIRREGVDNDMDALAEDALDDAFGERMSPSISQHYGIRAYEYKRGTKQTNISDFVDVLMRDAGYGKVSPETYRSYAARGHTEGFEDISEEDIEPEKIIRPTWGPLKHIARNADRKIAGLTGEKKRLARRLEDARWGFMPRELRKPEYAEALGLDEEETQGWAQAIESDIADVESEMSYQKQRREAISKVESKIFKIDYAIMDKTNRYLHRFPKTGIFKRDWRIPK